MRLISSIAFSLVTATALLFSGCSDATPAKQEVAKPTYSEESLGLRKVDLYSENTVTPDETKYSKAAPMSGKFINRAFQDAPPMIPHDVEGMLPIKIGNNACISCHMPAVAQNMGATAIPGSHFTDFRPATSLASDGRITKNGKAVDNTSSDKLENVSIKEVSDLAGARFNCSQCHAPQSEGQLVENTFTPDFTSKDGAKKSAWSGSKLTEGLDTLMD
jgi:cytochrome c-type protein NapB